MSKKSVKFDLINNAKDSLNHAVEHLTNPDGVEVGDLKRAVRDVAHVVELLLKEKLRRIHPAFVWQDVDKYPSTGAYIVSTGKALERLFKIGGISLTDECKKTIYACKRIRDAIEHYEFRLNAKEVRGIIGRLLSFIFDFSKNQLQVDLEKEFRQDDRWSELIDIYEFWEAHAESLEKRLIEQNVPICSCPACGADTFDLSEDMCVLCSHQEQQIRCVKCGSTVWSSDAETFECVDGDADSGITHVDSITMCKDCIRAEADEQMALEAMADSLRDELSAKDHNRNHEK